MSPSVLNPLRFVLGLLLTSLSGPYLSQAQAECQSLPVRQLSQFIKQDVLLQRAVRSLGDPQDFQPRFVSEGETTTAEQEVILSGHITSSAPLGDFKVALRLPKNFKPDRAYPTTLIVGGIDSSLETLLGIPPTGENILVIYQYPGVDISQLRRFFERDLKGIPLQVAVLLLWLSQQSYVDDARLNAVGISFGGIVLPVSLRLSSLLNVDVAATIFAYTGGEVAKVATDILGLNSTERSLIGCLLLGLTAFVDPVVHLPELQSGRYLLVMSLEDELFSPYSTQAFIEATPEPKTLIPLTGAHLQARRPDLIDQLIEISFNWLISQGVANP